MFFLRPYSEQIYALFRIVTAFLYMLHGVQKLFGVLGGKQMELASLMGTAGIIEFFCGLLVLVGLFASPAAFLASGEMAGAYFIQHVPAGWNPLTNEGERAAFYSFAFLYIASRGAGLMSLDRLRRR
jgi:putative oxidoreductase